MIDNQKISAKSFFDKVNMLIESATKEKLSSFVLKLAEETKIQHRKNFLDNIENSFMQKEEESPSLENELFEQVEMFVNRLKNAIEDRTECYDDYHEYYDYYEDDEENSYYDDYIFELTELIDKVDFVFDNGDFKNASLAYEKLFSVLNIEDEFGCSVTVHSLPEQSFFKYVRSVLETIPIEKKAAKFFEIINSFREIEITIKDILNICDKKIDDEELFLNSCVELFKTKHDFIKADTYVREAVFIKDGIEGLKQLVLSDGKNRPRVFIDLINKYLLNDEHSFVIEIAENAFEVLPAGLPILSTVAKKLKISAEYLGNIELIEKALWVSFYNQPDLINFADLCIYYYKKENYREIMDRVIFRINEYLYSDIPTCAYTLYSNEYNDSYVSKNPLVLLHAYLLTQQWEIAINLAIVNEKNTWIYLPVLVPLLLALLQKKEMNALSKNVLRMLKQGFDKYGKDNLEKLELIYSIYLPVNDFQHDEEIIDLCLDICNKQVYSIVGNKRRHSYFEAAMITYACYETLIEINDRSKANDFLANIKNKYKHYRAFKAELEQCL